MEDNIRSFKRPHNPIFENNINKRGKFSDQFSETSNSSETLYRILCHSRKIGSVIGKGGVIIKALREETQAKITIDDSIPGSEERVVIIYSPSTKKPVTHNDMNLQCAAQDALLKVHDKILEEDINNNEKLVTTRILVPNNMVGCLLGKKGDVIQRLRSETRANIRILPSDQLPVCALSTDELVQISAKPAIVKRALYEISTLLHHHPRKDNFIPSGPHGFHPPGPQITNLPPPARWRGDYGSDQSRFGDTPSEFSMKILCSTAKIGGVIGKGGSNVRQIQQETGTDIHVDDVAADSDERVICVSSFEDLRNPRSRTIDAILFLQEKASDYSEKGIVSTRLLLPSSKVGCILGQGGHVINEMRRRTKADIRVYSKQEKPKCASKDEELVKVSGIYGTVKDAVAEIASRYRERCLRDAKPEAESSPHGGRLAGYEPFTGSGRVYDEPRSYPPPTRDYELYSHLAPHRDYETYSHQALVRDYEGGGYRAPIREYESNDYVAPRMGYPSPLRDYEYEPQGYQRFLRGVDMKMSSSSRGFSIGNASEITGTRPYGGASESSIADIHDPSQHLNSTHESYQIYNLPKHPSHTNTNPTSHTPYNHYSQKSYHI
ncbi:hypothetical protein Lser_V15G12503 [Lactuca serriola]